MQGTLLICLVVLKFTTLRLASGTWLILRLVHHCNNEQALHLASTLVMRVCLLCPTI